MCGRYGFGNPARLGELPFNVPLPDLEPRWNVAPGQLVPLVLEEPEGRRAVMARWGLVPEWAADPSIGNRLINARGDTIRVKPAFQKAFRSRRGLMPADLFYEWQAVAGSRTKQPWCIRLPGDAPFAFGAIWERWLPTGAEPPVEPLVTCALITTAPNEVMAPIHDRMPVIVPPGAFTTWLDPRTREEDAFALLAPFAGELRAYPVATIVNATKNDDARCIESITA
jgi:putative SOS response-associated peptidase YedK